jgi:hypothetical protein
MSGIVGLQLRLIPEWIAEWGWKDKVNMWEYVQRVTRALWILGIAVMLTAIGGRTSTERTQMGGRPEYCWRRWLVR